MKDEKKKTEQGTEATVKRKPRKARVGWIEYARPCQICAPEIIRPTEFLRFSACGGGEGGSEMKETRDECSTGGGGGG